MTSYKRIGAIKKGIEVLSFLARQEKPVSAQLVAETLDMPYATAMCYLATLEDGGLVCLEGEDWCLGLGMAMFWSKYKRRLERQRYDIDQDMKRIEI